MEHFEIEHTESGLHINGFPDAAKMLKLSGHKARQLSELASHRFDLLIALDSLEGINTVSPDMSLVRQGLWRSAIEHCVKCFSDSKSRSRLNPKKVFKGDSDALEVFEYFKILRNKHIAHDENAYTECIPGAILNKPNSERKIAKVVCLNAVAETLEQDNYSNLHKMVSETLKHVVTRFDNLCDDIAAELEALSYEQLAAMEQMVYSKPKLEDIGETRARH